MKAKLLAAAAVAGVLAVLASGCASSGGGTPSSGAPKKDVTVGVLAREVPEMQYMADELKKQGYNITIKAMDDNIAMNNATAEGSLDANFFQNQKYLDSQNAQTHLGLKSVGPWLETTAMQFVSGKYKTIGDLPNGAKIAISNDVANQARGLQLLAANGLITLPKDQSTPTVTMIKDNPKNVQFVQTDPRSLAGMFPDADAIIAPSITIYLMKADPVYTLAEEKPDVYENYGGLVWVIAAKADPKAPWLQAAITFMESDTWKSWLTDHYKGLKKVPDAAKS